MFEASPSGRMKSGPVGGCKRVGEKGKCPKRRLRLILIYTKTHELLDLGQYEYVFYLYSNFYIMHL